MVRHLVLVPVVLAVLVVGGACSGDDGEAVVTDDASSSDAPADDVEGGPCDAIQVLLKLDITADERDRVKARLEAVDGVTAIELQEPAGEGEPGVFLVSTRSQEAADAIGKALAGDPGVVSVVHPEQVC